MVKGESIVSVKDHVGELCRSLYSMMESLKQKNPKDSTPEDKVIMRSAFYFWWLFNSIGGKCYV